jgi:hypothetical protein
MKKLKASTVTRKLGVLRKELNTLHTSGLSAAEQSDRGSAIMLEMAELHRRWDGEGDH